MPIKNICFNDIRLKAKKGFTIKDAEAIEFNNVQIDKEEGPAVYAEKTILLEINGLKTYNPHENTLVIEMEEVENACIHNCSQGIPTDIFLQLNNGTKNIEFNNNYLNETKTPSLKKELKQ